jgi:hypothetical protein
MGMKQFLILCLLISQTCFAQESILLIGNSEKLCYLEQFSIANSEKLPDDLSIFKAIYIFSNSTSQLTKIDIQSIISYVENGGGLYTGSENWPFQAESRQITQELYKKENYGEYKISAASTSGQDGNLNLKTIAEIPAGESTVAFPLDHRLTVEAWIEDQPLILSGDYGKGRIIIDGGYSRFYCAHRTEICDQLFERFKDYLTAE